MNFELWLAFIVAYSIISIIPGPSVFVVTGMALTRGLRAAFLCLLGDLLAGVVLITLSLFGVGAILATSATLFQIVKWIGVFYMAYLGYRQIADARNSKTSQNRHMVKPKPINSIKIGFLTGVLNPKAIIFYMAFLSQFLNAESDVIRQFLILVPSSTLIVGIVLSGYALFAARVRKTFESEKAKTRFAYTGGGFLIGGSVLIASTR